MTAEWTPELEAKARNYARLMASDGVVQLVDDLCDVLDAQKRELDAAQEIIEQARRITPYAGFAFLSQAPTEVQHNMWRLRDSVNAYDALRGEEDG